MSISTRALAEFFGTFWLVFGGCGSALFAAAYPQLGIGFAGVALAFGLTLLTMAFAIGHISGAHLNPAVSFGLYAAGRFAARDLVPYIVAQVLGGIAASGCLYIIAIGKEGFSRAGASPPTATAYTHPAAIPCSPASSQSFSSPPSSSSSSSAQPTSALPRASLPSPSAFA